MKLRWLIRQHYSPMTTTDEAGNEVIMEKFIVTDKRVLQYQEEFHELGLERKWIDIPVIIEPPKEEKHETKRRKN